MFWGVWGVFGVRLVGCLGVFGTCMKSENGVITSILAGDYADSPVADGENRQTKIGKPLTKRCWRSWALSSMAAPVAAGGSS